MLKSTKLIRRKDILVRKSPVEEGTLCVGGGEDKHFDLARSKGTVERDC